MSDVDQGHGPPLRSVELFAGAGLMSLALADAGFEVTTAVEIDPVFAASHRRNVGTCIAGDARDFRPSTGVDLVAGGPPCVRFSYAGHRDGTSHEIGTLYREVLRSAVEARARALWIENVPGLVTANEGRDLRGLLDELAAIGFSTHHTVLDAACFGAPQHRKRFMFVGFRDPAAATAFAWPTVTHGPHVRPFATVRDALGLRGRYATARRLDHATSSAKGKERGWWQGGRTIDVDRPGYTVGTRDNADLLVPTDAVAEREIASLRAASGRKPNDDGYRLNWPELSRLQEFPIDFVFEGTAAQKHAQIGNALPRSLGRVVARSIARVLAW